MPQHLIGRGRFEPSRHARADSGIGSRCTQNRSQALLPHGTNRHARGFLRFRISFPPSRTQNRRNGFPKPLPRDFYEKVPLDVFRLFWSMASLTGWFTNAMGIIPDTIGFQTYAGNRWEHFPQPSFGVSSPRVGYPKSQLQIRRCNPLKDRSQ
jgi:hypothetical protein